MLAVAAYGLMLLARCPSQFAGAAGWDVDIAHLFMGVSMAGMFVTGWAFGPHRRLGAHFRSPSLVWFLVPRACNRYFAFGNPPHALL